MIQPRDAALETEQEYDARKRALEALEAARLRAVPDATFPDRLANLLGNPSEEFLAWWLKEIRKAVTPRDRNEAVETAYILGVELGVEVGRSL